MDHRPWCLYKSELFLLRKLLKTMFIAIYKKILLNSTIWKYSAATYFFIMQQK